jgi:DNA polymerase III subunit gamma/tau
MAYLVMARKWRPRNFDEMVGQEHIARTLRNAIEGKRIAHAYLFTGTRGVGKTTSARILAKALNCEKGPTPSPCDVCDSCKAVSAGTSMDVLEIDGASNRGVGEIRELREQVKYAPMQGTFKVYIIDEVHMLTKEAFNALLKTLEEPPAHVVFLFATTEANKVPHTILSRVQRFDFKRISEAQIRGRLEFICGKEGITFETEALEAIARKADGSMRDGLSLFDQVLAFSGSNLTLDDARRILGLPPDELFSQLLDALVEHNPAACYGLIERVVGEGIELGEFLLGFGTHLRDILFARQEGMAASALGFSERRFLELRSTHAELRDGDLIRYGKMVSDMLAGLKQAAHPRLHIEMGVLRMAALDRIATLSQLMQSGAGQSETVATHAAPANRAAPKSPLSTAVQPSPSPAESPASMEASKKKSPIELGSSQSAEPRSGLREHAPAMGSRSAQLEPSASPSITAVLERPSPETEAKEARAEIPDTELEPEFQRDFESDLERDLDLDPDLLPVAAKNAKPEPVRFDSLESLAQNWALVLQDILAEPSLITIHLGGSRLIALPPEEGSSLNPCKLELAHQVAFEFFNTNNESRKKATALLQGCLRDPQEITLGFALKNGSELESAQPAKVTPGLRIRLADEPIVQTLIQLFDGRVVMNHGH